MQRFDFNLLQALDALLQEGSVRGAAERLNLTAPAMSHALARLRVVLDDPLLVRAGQRLVATPRAMAIRDEVRRTVENGRSILQDRPRHRLKDVRRTFTVRANDSTICVFGASLIERVQAEAPGIQIRFAARADESVGPLRDGTVDLDLGAIADMGPEIQAERLLQDDFVCALRHDHSLAGSSMTAEDYARCRHVVASRRGRALGPIDASLAETGLTRRVPVVVPDTLSAIALTAASDYIATIPRSVAIWGSRMMGLVVKPLPVAAPPITMFQSWHPRLAVDQPHIWLRECMAAVAQTASAPPGVSQTTIKGRAPCRADQEQ